MKPKRSFFKRISFGVLRFFAWWGGMFAFLGGGSGVCPFCGRPGCGAGPAAAGLLGALFAVAVSLPKWFARRKQRKLEDRFWAEEGKEALAEFRKSGSKAIPLEKLKAELGL